MTDGFSPFIYAGKVCTHDHHMYIKSSETIAISLVKEDVLTKLKEYAATNELLGPLTCWLEIWLNNKCIKSEKLKE